MLNNRGTYGRNEAPPNMVSSINSSEPNASNINHNFNDFVKFEARAASSTSGYYEAQNYQNFGQPAVNMPPIINPFQAYQNMGNGSTYFPHNPQFSYENASQSYVPAVTTTTQADHHNNMLNCAQNLHVKPLSVLQTALEKESYSSKPYPLNIPQVPSKLGQKDLNISRNNTNAPIISENITPLSQNVQEISTNISQSNLIREDDVNSPTNLSLSDKSQNQSKPDHAEVKVTNNEQLENETLEKSPTIKKTSYNIVNLNRTSSILEKTLTDSKRKSLEKTVKLIESILINSNNPKSDVIENTTDPLAFSPNPDIINKDIDANTENNNSNKGTTKKAATKNKRKSQAKKAKITKEAIDNTTQITNEIQIKIEDIKMETSSWTEVDYENPFHRDCNGVLQTDVAPDNIVDMENSVTEATEIIKSGTPSKSFFECPHCSLLLPNPKRFLIHTKWHTFGLLNEKRAEIMRIKEERTKEKREARSLSYRAIAEMAATEGAEVFTCKDCNKIFQTKSSLKNHRHKYHPTEVTECRICLAPMRGMGELRAHMAVHEAAGLFQCPRCPKRFKFKHSLAKHADTHREKTHSCPDCGKLFGSSYLVRLHSKVHERAARGTTHRCAYCGKGFYEAYNLQVHERTHRNDKPFKCDICESCFVTNSSLKRHVKVSHSGAKPYTCPVCQKCFSSASIRDRHELRAHSDQQQFPHQCRQCPRRYMKPKDLRNHTYKMHPKEKQKSISDTEQSTA